jgi:hypothetical protein
MKSLNLHKLRTLTALLSFAALLAAPQAFAADITPPQLESFNLLTTEINVTDGPASVYAEFRVTDDESGIKRPQIYAYSDTTTQSGKTFGSTVSELTSSFDGLNILYRAEIVINQGSAPGPWTVRLNGLQDNLGNRGPTGPAKLAGYNTAFTVVEDTPDQQSTDASSSSSDSDEDDPCSGTGFNPNCNDSSSDSTSSDSGSTSFGSTSDSDSGSTSSSSSSDGSSDGAGGTACDPEVDFGCRDGYPAGSSDGTGDTSGDGFFLGGDS